MINEHVKYDRHADEFDACIADVDRKKIAESWFQQLDTLDAWRHQRMHSLVIPIVNTNPSATWLTVGDGRFGSDGNALLKYGARSVHCTDITDILLKIGSEKGFINEYSKQNAEDLNFVDNAFDYVYCKEAFHHFPRPYVALNEMFRVAKCAVILTEPRDSVIDLALLSPVFFLLKKFLGKKTKRHDFETVGNYIYTLSEREMEKFLLGMHYCFIGFCGINDAYQEGIEFVFLDSKSINDKIIIYKTKLKILMLNIFEKFKFKKSGLISVILFKERPSDLLIKNLKLFGWSIKELPKNPYLR